MWVTPGEWHNCWGLMLSVPATPLSQTSLSLYSSRDTEHLRHNIKDNLKNVQNVTHILITSHKLLPTYIRIKILKVWGWQVFLSSFAGNPLHSFPPVTPSLSSWCFVWAVLCFTASSGEPRTFDCICKTVLKMYGEMSQMTNIQKKEEERGKVILIYKRTQLKLFLKDHAPCNLSDGWLKALMPQK